MDSAFNVVPSHFQTAQLTAGSRGLGEICMSRDAMPDGTVCNPSFLPELKEDTLLGRVYLGNGYTALSTAHQFLYKPLTQEFLQNLFRSNNVTSVEGHLQLAFATRYFSAEFSPYRIQYISEVHNPNLPVISIHAAMEKSMTLAGGMPLSIFSPHLEDFTAGMSLRVLQRNHVHGSFSLLDAIGNSPRSLVPIKTQHGVLMEPSIGWASSKLPWKLRTSLGVKELGKVWPEDPLYPVVLDFSFGIGLEPPLKMGRWRLGLDLVHLIHGKDFLSRIRFGSSYKFGIAEAIAGLSQVSFASGVQFGLNLITASIVYEFVRESMGGITPGSKIATELAVKL
jgi:hypothetical protein